MANIIAPNICYGLGSGNNWTDGLTSVSLAYSNSIIYLKFSFDQSISSCDEIKIKIKDDPGELQAGSEVFNICISVFKYNEEYIHQYTNSDIFPSHSGIIHREYTVYNKNSENEYIIPTDMMISTGPGIEYIVMIGTYDNEYGTSAGLKVENTSVEGIEGIRIVTYDMNTGDGENNVIEIVKGQNISITEDIPVKTGDIEVTEFIIKGMYNYAENNEGYTSITGKKTEGLLYRFLGWSSKANSITPEYVAGDSIDIYNDITFYAVWESYTDIYYENNKLSGLEIPSRDSIEENYTVTLNPNNGDENIIMKAGKSTNYIFKGWGISGTSIEVLDMETEYFKDITVYAIWEIEFIDNSGIYLPIIENKSATEINSYVVTLDANGGIIDTEDTDITAIRKITYAFDGWVIDNDDMTPVDMYFVPTKSIQLIASYKTESSIQPINLPIAIKNGYIFTGWNEEKDSGINVVNPYITDKHITLYAHFVSKNKLKMHIYHDGKWHHIIM